MTTKLLKTLEAENELAIPAGFEPATHGVEIRHSADHRLTTETPRTNGDKVRESSTNSIVFVEFFDCYLRSGRRGRRFLRTVRQFAMRRRKGTTWDSSARLSTGKFARMVCAT